MSVPSGNLGDSSMVVGGHGRLHGQLYIVSTPIGNLGDFSARAIETLNRVALIVAEDTRHSRPLLDHFEIRTPTQAYHEHNEAKETPRIVEQLRAGDDVALISDAGTPLVSDPGSRLVRACIDAEISVVPIPGASAVLASLVASGLPGDRFAFYGFLERKGAARTREMQEIIRSPVTTVIYESPHRVQKTLADFSEYGAGDRQAVIARELTKRFEEFQRGTIDELLHQIGDQPLRGEVVILLEGNTVSTDMPESRLREYIIEWRSEGASARDITDRLMAQFGVSRNAAYQLAHGIEKNITKEHPTTEPTS